MRSGLARYLETIAAVERVMASLDAADGIGERVRVVVELRQVLDVAAEAHRARCRPS